MFKQADTTLIPLTNLVGYAVNACVLRLLAKLRYFYKLVLYKIISFMNACRMSNNYATI